MKTNLRLSVFSLFFLAFTVCSFSQNNKVRVQKSVKEKNLTRDTANTFVDMRDGKRYKFVAIGNKLWMAENLNFDMDKIGSFHYPTEMLNLEKKYVTEAITFYHIQEKEILGLSEINILKKISRNLSKILNKYPQGWRYYTYSASKTACPDGWRLPDNDDWSSLLNANVQENRSLMQIDSLAYWKKNYHNPILAIRLGDYFGHDFIFWSSSETPERFYYVDSFSPSGINNGKSGRGTNEIGFCIRCVKDISNENNFLCDFAIGKLYDDFSGNLESGDVGGSCEISFSLNPRGKLDGTLVQYYGTEGGKYATQTLTDLTIAADGNIVFAVNWFIDKYNGEEPVAQNTKANGTISTKSLTITFDLPESDTIKLTARDSKGYIKPERFQLKR